MENVSATIDFKLFPSQIGGSNAVVVFVHHHHHLVHLHSHDCH